MLLLLLHSAVIQHYCICKICSLWVQKPMKVSNLANQFYSTLSKLCSIGDIHLEPVAAEGKIKVGPLDILTMEFFGEILTHFDMHHNFVASKLRTLHIFS